MKKLLSFLLAIILIVSAVPLGAFEFRASAATYTEEQLQQLINNIDSIGEVEFSEECHTKILALEQIKIRGRFRKNQKIRGRFRDWR